ncbi:hypothetical protein GCU56_10910 [Geodermatophilus sabuli]|uniref:ABC transporter permease n=1 Tax=Geodermatophilus sabuli TaxID=1564158 RepID=A0A7K3W0H8_9ACTN|nr:hypothetical protein [Geodermatophilus sabuli]NEK58381.1 hypothetical protein [Geodermatophilus sabuli]
MTASNPQPGDSPAGGDGPRPSDLRRWAIRALVALVVLVVVAAIAVLLSRVLGSDDPSGGPDRALGLLLATPAGRLLAAC